MMPWLAHSFGKFAIAAWYGSIASIPENWVICDGTNGTPDLRDRFIVGAGDSYTPGNTGGAKFVPISGTTDGHKHPIAAGANISGIGDRVADNETSVDTDTFHGLHGENRPPFYGLVYIMHT